MAQFATTEDRGNLVDQHGGSPDPGRRGLGLNADRMRERVSGRISVGRSELGRLVLGC
jgi:hypothetical protein